MIDRANYVFNITPANSTDLLQQVSLALEKQTELDSRAKYPQMWAHTDQLNAKEKAPEPVRKRRRIVRKIFGVINLALGLLLFVTGLMDIQELLVPFLVGVLGILAGVIGLFGKRGGGRTQFITPAKRLLHGQQHIVAGENQAVFGEETMEIRTKNAGESAVAYSGVECIIETQDIFLVIYQGTVTILQKKDLQGGSLQAFCEFVGSKTLLVSA